jgi:hypothetical protein
MALVPLPLSGQQAHTLQIVLLSMVSDNTLTGHITEANNAKIDCAGAILRDACRKKTSGYFLPSRV